MTDPSNAPPTQPPYPPYQYPPVPGNSEQPQTYPASYTPYPPAPNAAPPSTPLYGGQYGSQPQYPPPGYPPYPPQPGQPGYPPPGYPQYPPQQMTPYGYNAPPQHLAPGQVYPGVRKVSNPFATRALVYGALAFGVNIIGLFVGFYLIGFFALFAIIYGFRALAYSSRLPNREGTGMAIGAIILGGLSILLTVLGFIVNAAR